MSRLQSLSLASHLDRVAGPSSAAVVPIDSIEPNPGQPRKLFAEASLAELAASIRAQGLLQPLLVREVSPSRYELIAGERRLRACRLAGLATVAVMFSDADSLEAALVENIQREDMALADEVLAVQRLVTRKTSSVAAAKALGKSEQWVSKRLCIAEAPSSVLDFARSGRCGDLEGLYELARLASRDEIKALKAIDSCGDGDSLRTQVRAINKELKTKGQDTKPKTSSPAPPASSGPGEHLPQRATDVGFCREVLTVTTKDQVLTVRLTHALARKLREQLEPA